MSEALRQGSADNPDCYAFEIDGDTLTVDGSARISANREGVEATAVALVVDAARCAGATAKDEAITVTARDRDGNLAYRATLSIRAGWIDPGDQ